MATQIGFAWPVPSLRLAYVWRRNFLVWQKLWPAYLAGNLADPLLYMMGLGFGLGAFLPDLEGMSYIAFLAAGTVAYGTMNSACFEATFSAFTRMYIQRTWEAILHAPLTLDDVILGEWAWSAFKSVLYGFALMAVIFALGISRSPLIVWIVPISLLIGVCFAGLSLVITSFAKSYDFFQFFFALVITPSTLLGGVFFPLTALPGWLRAIADALPLTHALQLVRPLLRGETPTHIVLHVSVLLAYAAVSLPIAFYFFRKRLLK